MTFSDFKIVLPFFVLFLIIIGILFSARHLFRLMEKQQRDRIVRHSDIEPISTDSPVEHPQRFAKARAMKSVRHRFTVIRRGLLFCFLLLLIGLISIPLLGTLSAASISLAIGAFSVIVGIAARSTLENLIAGIMLTFSGVIREADTVIIGEHYGTIEDITWTHTVIKIWNWHRKLIPNSILLNTEFVNLTIYDNFQWRHIEFWVSLEADIQQVRKAAIESALASEHNANYEDPSFWIMEMDKEGIRCWVAAWADSPSHAWELSHDIRTQLTERLQKQGIMGHQYHIRFTQAHPKVDPAQPIKTDAMPPFV